MGQPYTRSRYYHLYLNGVYWGLFQTQERSEARYAETYFGADKDDYDTVKVNSGLTGTNTSYNWGPYTLMATDGTLDAWYRLWAAAKAGFGTDEAYYRVQGMNPDGTPNPAYEVLLDVDNLIDYMTIVFYGGNLDAPVTWFGNDSNPNNIYMVYNRNQPDGFKFFVHDAEHTLLLGKIHTAVDELYRDRTGPFAIHGDAYSNPQWLHQRLSANADYRQRFADRAHRYFFNGGLLTPEAAAARFLSRKEEIELAVIAESARWGDAPAWLNTPRTRDDWLWATNDIVNRYFPQRTAIVIEQLRAYQVPLYPSFDAPVFKINGNSQHGGNISAGDLLTMINPNGAGTIYYASDGAVDLQPYSVTETTIVGEDAAKRVLVPSGSVSTYWRSSTSYYDTNWQEGSGGVGYDRNGKLNEYISISVENEMYSTYTSCYIRIPFYVSSDSIGSFDTMTLRIRYDDGFVAYINGSKVAEMNAPDVVGWDSKAEYAVLTVSLREFNVTEGISLLKAGNNLLAIHGMNSTTTSSDFLISAALVAMAGDALPLDRTTHVSARILKDDKWSALNEATYATPDAVDALRITEIMYHPEGDALDNDGAEFIELQNVGTAVINLINSRFVEGIHFAFPHMLLEPGGHVVVVRDRIGFDARYPAYTGIVAGEYAGSLENSGERIRLEDPTGVVIHDFSYGDGWYPITDGGGFSLIAVYPEDPDKTAWDRKDGWRPSNLAGGSPGVDDGDLLPNPGSVVINEILSHSHDEDPDWIELYNASGASVNIGGWYLSDGDIDLMKYEIPTGTMIPAGGYAVFYQDQHFGSAFALSENGETVYLSSGQSGTLTGYRAVETFGASESNIAFGRYQKSTGTFNFVAMSANTPGEANAYPKVGPVVVTEIMYHPATGNEGEEYIELHNISGEPVILQEFDEGTGTTTTWRFTDGIEYEFPMNTTIPAYGYLLVAKDPAAFAPAYSAPVGIPVLGPYDGQLSNGGEKVEISMPGDVDELGERRYIRIDRVNYDDEAPWPIEADGGGSSLQRITPEDYGNDIVNWQATSPTPGS